MRTFTRHNGNCGFWISECGLNSRPPIRNPKSEIRNRSGVTLLELLIVIVILTTLVAAAIPLMTPASDARRIREASRGLNTYISSAQAKAVRVGRPVGVAFKRLSSDTGSVSDRPVCIEVYQVEQPPPFAGFSETSRIMLALDNGENGEVGQVIVRFVQRGPTVNDGLPHGWDDDLIPPYFYRPGDVVELGDLRCELIDISVDPASGFYNAASGTPDGRLVARPLNDTGQTLPVVYDNVGNRLPSIFPRPPDAPPPLHYWTEPFAYKILRQPMLTSAEPLQLPEGTAIDLTASGAPIRFGPPIGNKPRMTGALHTPPNQSNPNEYDVANPVDNNDPIVIMFTPEGTIERLRMNLEPGYPGQLDSYNEPINDNFFLLIGLRANIPSEINDYASTFSPLTSFSQEELAEGRTKVNWLNLESRWVVVGSQTGTVATVENAAAEPFAIQALVEDNQLTPEPVFQRAYEINKAREFARELTRTGGR